MFTDLKDLKESNEFLNLLLENIDQAVIIVDENFKIFQVNNYFFQLFDSATESVVDKRFGRVSGCVHSVLENRPCGEAQACKDCVLKNTVVKTLVERVPADRVQLNRKFYINNRPMDKYMQFSTRYLKFHGRKMILVVIYDITDTELQKIELQKKQAQIEIDLAAAAEIQKSLLPVAAPDFENMQIAWKFKPSGKIGGDIFNICRIGKDRIGIYMLDVCGHGVSASLIAVAVSQFLTSRRVLSKNDFIAQSPKKVLNSLNQAFPFERFDSFFSIVHMNIDSRFGLLTYGNAGHPPPVVLHEDGEIEILGKNGPVIGMDRDFQYGDDRKMLKRGDKIVLYTDGVPEVCDKGGEFFGKERFFEILKANSRMSPADLVETVYSTTMKYCENSEIHDDVSILVAEYAG